MAINYSGDSLSMGEEDPRLDYVIPQEGGEYYIDCMIIMRDAPNGRLAQQFVNFFHDPQIHAANVLFLKYASANFKALEIIKVKSPAYFSNPGIDK